MDSIRSYGAQAWNQSMGFLSSTGLIPQLVLTVIIVLAIHFLIVAVESLVTGIQKYNQLSQTLFDYTIASKGRDESGEVFPADKNFMYPSENEVNGIEFSYSFHLYIDPNNYSSERTTHDNTFRTVFYRGSDVGPWPILGPGVFLNSKHNNLRVYMNSMNAVKDQYVEIPNIPVGKWFHVVLTQKGQSMDVYLNGNIAVRHTFKTIPRLNVGSVHVFPGTQMNASSELPDIPRIMGPVEGMISRLKYYAYALSFSQIDSLSSEGASKKIKSTSYDFKPPYLHDSWWVTRYGDHNQHYGL
jgi:hypothetical protein